MKKNFFAGNLQRTFISFRRLEKQSNVQESSQIGDDEQLVISPPIAVAEINEFPETETSPSRTMRVLRSSLPGINNGEGVSNMNNDRVGSAQSSGDSYAKAHCEDKFRSLSQVNCKHQGGRRVYRLSSWWEE